MYVHPQALNFFRRYYVQLVGRKIVAAGIGPDGTPWFVLDSGARVEVLQDPEGNGPGFLAGLPDANEG